MVSLKYGIMLVDDGCTIKLKVNRTWIPPAAPYNTATKCAECQLAFFQSIPNLIPYFGFNSNDPQNVNLQKGLSVIQECRGQLAGPMSSALGTPRLIGLQGLMSCPTNDQAAYAPVFAYIEQHMS